jgi:predicted ATPase
MTAGKTRLIQQTLSPKVASLGGYLLAGKFDPLRRPEPYVGFCSAFSQFVTQVVQNGAAKTVRKALAEAGVGKEDWKVLAGMIPLLRQIFLDEEVPTTTAASPKQDPGASLRRFAYVFLMFVRAISSLSLPVVLLLDDLQFADQSSLLILSNIVADLANCPSLFVVITFDDSYSEQENNHQDTFEKMVCDAICDSVTRVYVGNLVLEGVKIFLSDVLDVKYSQKTSELATLVFNQTQGHVFYTMMFVKHLIENKWLDASGTGWLFDAETIRVSIKTTSSCSVLDFVMLQLAAVSPEVQQFLKVASSCGSQVPTELLRYIFGEATVSLLQEACALELILILQRDSDGKEIYSFSHDLIQQSVYALIPKNEREQFHLEIGRRMWIAFKGTDLERSAYVLASQFYFAKHLVTEQKERCDLAQLCLLAGRKAAASSTFRTACIFLSLGIEFLGDTGWRDHYHLSLALYNAAAEMHLCINEFDEMERLVRCVMKEARLIDRIHSETTLVYAMGMINKQNESIDLGIQLLARLGVTFPRRLSTARVLIEVARVHVQLMGKSDEELICLPTMEDSEKLACVQILNLLCLQTTLIRPQLTPFVILKLTRLTLKHGQCLMSPVAFATYGVIMAVMGRIDDAYRYGQLGIKMAERSGHDEYLPRLYAAVYGVINPLKRPISEGLAKLHEGYQIGLQTGDFETACLNANIYVYQSIDGSMPLASLDKEYMRMTSVMTALGQESMLRFSMPCVQAIHHYMGLTEDPMSSKGDLFDYETAYQWCLQNNQGNLATGVVIHRLVLSCVFNDFTDAFVQAERCYRAIADMPGPLDTVATLFYVSIAYLENASGKSFWWKREAFRVARRGTSMLRRLSLCSPYNLSHVHMLLEAEVAVAKGRDVAAFQLYLSAIAGAQSHKFLLSEAFANERCGRFLHKVQRMDEARSFLEEACRAYERWGGTAKVVRLTEDIQSLFATKS